MVVENRGSLKMEILFILLCFFIEMGLTYLRGTSKLLLTENNLEFLISHLLSAEIICTPSYQV